MPRNATKYEIIKIHLLHCIQTDNAHTSHLAHNINNNWVIFFRFKDTSGLTAVQIVFFFVLIAFPLGILRIILGVTL